METVVVVSTFSGDEGEWFGGEEDGDVGDDWTQVAWLCEVPDEADEVVGVDCEVEAANEDNEVCSCK